MSFYQNMFEKISAQTKPKKVLSAQIKSGKVAHAYIFIGQSGVGKKLTAIEFAKIINCTVNDFTKSHLGACGKCNSCRKIEKGAYSDLHIIDFQKQAELLDEDEKKPSKNKVIKIETIRYIQKQALTSPLEGKWKIFIIDPAEKMNAAAANCLLKTLEEPPARTMLILIAAHKETIPQTIVSRSQVLYFQPLKEGDVLSYLLINQGLSSDKAEKIASLSEGSLETARRIAENESSAALDLWLKLKNTPLCASDILDLSRLHSKTALETVDALILEAKKDFRLFPQKTQDKLESLFNYKALLLKNVNPQTVMDNLFLDLTETI